MIICVQLESKSKDELDRLMALGQYRDYSEAVAVSISNQLLLHSGNVNAPVEVRVFSTGAPESIKQSAESESSRPTGLGVPALFSPVKEDRTEVKIAAQTDEPFESGQTVFIDQWIWGQHNKLLPLKATCRALAHLLTRAPASCEGIPLSKASTEIAAEAVKLGDYLRRKERELGLLRDDGLAHAFPRRDAENEDKSRLRFATQFVGNIGSDGVLTGLPSDLKFVSLDGPRSTRILLTEDGWKFAQMENPSLDSIHGRPIRRFTEEEVHFLFSHIMKKVPYEAFAYNAVVKLIKAGENTPELLDQALGDYLPSRNTKRLSPAFLTTQRAGVISRLSDLGIVQRVRDGIKVTYALTEFGHQCFSNPI